MCLSFYRYIQIDNTKAHGCFEHNIYSLLLWSFIFTIFSELAFTFYVSNYGFSNLIGHYFKLFSFYLMGKAIVISGIQEPYALIFRELNKKNEKLEEEIDIRLKAENLLANTVSDLNLAISNVKILSNMLPICASCKKIRDDKGYWSQVETYISNHTDTVFSHGICPDCEKKAYAELEKFKQQLGH